ncbi:hypothetical protein EF834_15450 [Rhodococcus spongiicola]|uniref:Uncharacterized protein n=1 Tax=Rhodococcus spongiicola TaxID=2487352 RepID=A0A438ASX3_9NOCA|nr:hypothetical protein EF834_15450 [Rhodococcus spongiicola]
MRMLLEVGCVAQTWAMHTSRSGADHLDRSNGLSDPREQNVNHGMAGSASTQPICFAHYGRRGSQSW